MTYEKLKAEYMELISKHYYAVQADFDLAQSQKGSPHEAGLLRKTERLWADFRDRQQIFLDFLFSLLKGDETGTPPMTYEKLKALHHEMLKRHYYAVQIDTRISEAEKQADLKYKAERIWSAFREAETAFMDALREYERGQGTDVSQAASPRSENRSQ